MDTSNVMYVAVKDIINHQDGVNRVRESNMKIDADTLNSNIEYCIDEYVRIYEHRDILREKWFEGFSITEIAEKHNLSETSVKNILYDQGDNILIRASKMNSSKYLLISQNFLRSLQKIFSTTKK